ncbi:T9SS C-terminal target domain-containing protein [Dysgonomonas sp. 216]|uniref:leucine-rich repeat domain-containing protein n=1 Tax=Dysgonomonas sp. 216 TaxID=2302934 RepID=UPI0013D4A11E|nr:leucine-rich repeat domain-containing protein [Dysgonomonas sp. 216]NDW18832.1 T9SS C-terminal target domain-containing protein [Dysgonomonas sp. 216]
MRKSSILTCLCFTFLILFGWNKSVNAQAYHDSDKEGLRNLLRQKSEVTGASNLNLLGINASDTVSWYSSEDWVEKISAYKGVVLIDWEWNINSPSRLVRFELKDISVYNVTTANKLSGDFDCSYFGELVYLNCSGSNFQSLNVNANSKLKELKCSSNDLNVLDLSSNADLRYLDCSDNKISVLSVSGNTKLTNLSCSKNKISNLDVSNNSLLTTLACGSNQISALNLSNNKDLQLLACSDNDIAELNVSQNTKLISLYCSGNIIVGNKLTMGTNKNLEVLDCSDNQLAGLSVSQLQGLKYLWCNNNKLMSGLNVSQNLNLESLSCSGNELSALNLTANTALLKLNCANNKLVTLNLFNNKNLNNLDCANNKLTSILMDNSETLYRSLVCNNNLLKFTSIPTFNNSFYWQLVYAPQDTIEGGEVYANTEIDLSEEYSVEGNITSYQWHKEGTSEAVTVTEMEDGVFKISNDYMNQKLVCQMDNALYPDLTLVYRIKLLPDTIVGIDDKQQNIGISVYPNPVDDILFINSNEDITGINIFTPTGVLIKSISLNEFNKENIKVNDLQSGIYVIKVTTLSGKSYIQKIKKN